MLTTHFSLLGAAALQRPLSESKSGATRVGCSKSSGFTKVYLQRPRFYTTTARGRLKTEKTKRIQ
jgi:hypothetical protein